MKMINNIKLVLFISLFVFSVSSPQNLTQNDLSSSVYADSLKEANSRSIGIGAIIGAPASMSLTAGLYLDPISFRVSGGAWGKGSYGLQADIAFPLTKSKELIQNISVIGGLFATKVIDTDPSQPFIQITRYYKQNYIGAAYDVYYAGFLMQTGLGFGKGNFPNPQFLFQFGYLFDFIF
jgi:hypothetical protein